MTVYVDSLHWHKGNMWCHMMTDGNIEELHQIADQIGLKREWFQDHPVHPHYDLSTSLRRKAVQAGAVETTSQDMVKRCSKMFNETRNQLEDSD